MQSTGDVYGRFGYATDRAGPAPGTPAEVIAMSTSAEPHEAMAELFLAAAAALSDRLRTAKAPFTMHVGSTVVQREDTTSWSTDQRPITRNALKISFSSRRCAPWLGEQELVLVHRCAAEIFAGNHESLPFWSPFEGPIWPFFSSLDDPADEPSDFQRNPVEWVTRHLVLPALLHHLEELPSIDKADEEAARAFADDLLRVAAATDLQYTVVVPLSGVHLDPAEPGELTEGRVRVRPLSAIQQGALFEEHGGLSPASLGRLEPPTLALEIHASGPRNAQNLPHGRGAATLVAAFQLHGYPVAGSAAMDGADPPWVFPGRAHVPLVLPGRSHKSAVLTTAGFNAVMATAKLLDRYNISQPASPRELAMHRFASGTARDNDTDALLDFTIALEALLLPYDENARRGDLGYRFRIHGAHYVAEGPEQRHAVAKQLSNIYGMRSQLVHGSKYPDTDKIKSARDTAHELARCGLLRAVTEGFPNAETFNRAILGSG
jgi:hypothetical protein